MTPLYIIVTDASSEKGYLVIINPSSITFANYTILTITCLLLCTFC